MHIERKANTRKEKVRSNLTSANSKDLSLRRNLKKATSQANLALDHNAWLFVCLFLN